MATGIDAAIVMQFDDQLMYAYQQKVPRLRQYVRTKSNIVGNQVQFEILGTSRAGNITGQRHARTQWLDPQSSARWAVKQDFAHPVMLDWAEQQEILVDLNAGYAMNGAMAMAREGDQIILDAATGIAATGPVGAGTSAFDTTAVSSDGTTGGLIAHGGAGLTEGKMRQVRGAFLAREVGVDDLNMGIRDAFIGVVSGKAMAQLLGEGTVVSRDYVSGQPLEDGFVAYWMGFRLVVSNLLATVSSMKRTLWWHRSAMGHAVWAERQITVDRLPEHNNSTGIQVMMSQGAVRVLDAGVIAVDVDESK